MLEKGLFVSHRGQSLCCVNRHRDKNVTPKEFWNGEKRQQSLKNMYDDKPVDGCETCYYSEANRVTSTRMTYKTSDHVPLKPNPTMLDLDFSNFCNLKCVMCGPERSSQHAKDVGKGIVSVPRQHIESLLEISGDVQEIQIQGGEPSIMDEFTYYFTELQKKGICKNINLQIISNLTNLNNNFLDTLKYFKSVSLGISIDAYGKANDYIRWPSKFGAIEKNIQKVLDVDTIKKVDIFNTLNILSMFNYYDFLTWAHEISEKYKKANRDFSVSAMKVYRPTHFSPFIAPESLKQLYINDVKRFYETPNLGPESKVKIEMMLIAKKLERSQTNQSELDKLVDIVSNLDHERSVKISDFIPNFHEHVQKSQ